MGAIASFDPDYWSKRYPEFAGIVDTTAPAYFAEAGLYLNNTGAGPVQDAITQKVLMHQLTAHLAELFDATSARGSQALVGRITDASQGTVRVHTDMGAAPGTAAWFQQTKYGAAFWQATSRFRSFRYLAPRPQARTFFPEEG